jgi:hypothetical protein
MIGLPNFLRVRDEIREQFCCFLRYGWIGAGDSEKKNPESGNGESATG